MREDRLNALMLLFVHKGIPLDHGKFIDKFATRHSRRMLLVDPVSSDWTFLNHTYLMIIHISVTHISIIHISIISITYFNHKYLMIIHISIINISWSYISQSYISSLDLDLDLLPLLTRSGISSNVTYMYNKAHFAITQWLGAHFCPLLKGWKLGISLFENT